MYVQCHQEPKYLMVLVSLPEHWGEAKEAGWLRCSQAEEIAMLLIPMLLIPRGI